MVDTEAKYLLNKDINELFEILGKSIIENEGGFQAFPPTKREMINAAEKYLNRHSAPLIPSFSI